MKMICRVSRVMVAVFVITLFYSVEAHAQSNNQLPCRRSPEFRQFDFWIGEWNVQTPDGQWAGESKIQLIEGDCVIFENYTGRTGYSGKSFNVYNASTGKWQQFWVDNQGGVLEFEGEFKDGEMRFAGSSFGGKGNTINHRLTFFQKQEGKVRQLWQQSTDGGATWNVVFDGLYSKK